VLRIEISQIGFLGNVQPSASERVANRRKRHGGMPIFANLPVIFAVSREGQGRPVRTSLRAPPRTLLPAGLLHALPNCASVQRLSAAVSEGLRLWLRAGARFPRFSTARLRLLETVSRRRMQRLVRERRRPVRKHLARVCGQNGSINRTAWSRYAGILIDFIPLSSAGRTARA
jgi:hypothetical protein